jgi:hypothetical protein
MVTHASQLEVESARRDWAMRVLRIGGVIQVSFAAFWLVRGSLAIGGLLGTALAAVLLAVAIAVLGYGLVATAGLAPRPRGGDAARLERAITIATVIQLSASFIAPFLVIALGHADLVLPSIAITIGPLLIWLDHRLSIPRFRSVGGALIVAPILVALVVSGSTLSAVVGIGAGALLLTTAVVGFRQLARDSVLHIARQLRPDAIPAPL